MLAGLFSFTIKHFIVKKEEQLKLAKAAKKKGPVKVIDVENKTIYLSKPTRQNLGLAMTKARSNPLGYAEVIIQNCYIAGDVSKEDLLNDGGMLTSLLNVMDDIIDSKEVEVKNF